MDQSVARSTLGNEVVGSSPVSTRLVSCYNISAFPHVDYLDVIDLEGYNSLP